jgi:hypothetical protein
MADEHAGTRPMPTELSKLVFPVSGGPGANGIVVADPETLSMFNPEVGKAIANAYPQHMSGIIRGVSAMRPEDDLVAEEPGETLLGPEPPRPRWYETGTRSGAMQIAQEALGIAALATMYYLGARRADQFAHAFGSQRPELKRRVTEALATAASRINDQVMDPGRRRELMRKAEAPPAGSAAVQWVHAALRAPVLDRAQRQEDAERAEEARGRRVAELRWRRREGERRLREQDKLCSRELRRRQREGERRLREQDKLCSREQDKLRSREQRIANGLRKQDERCAREKWEHRVNRSRGFYEDMSRYEEKPPPPPPLIRFRFIP